jgi:4-diphosphocytidyl-2-C-methyl-D-erythritol kinase
LGGGSADAAATLRAVNTLFGLNLSAAELRAAAAQIGMDVPFLIEGGRAIGRKRGDRLEPLAVRQPAWAVVAIPTVSVSTRWAYEQLDRIAPAETPSLEAFVHDLQTQPLRDWARRCYNGFERVVFPACPRLERLRDRLREAGCVAALLSGSGSAVVGLTDDGDHAAEVARETAPLCPRVEAVPFLTRSAGLE